MLASLLLPAALLAGDPCGTWPQWRGPGRDGTVAFTLPASLDGAALTEAWGVPLRPSYSGPVTDGTRVFTTETVRGSRYEFHPETLTGEVGSGSPVSVPQRH